MNKSLLTVAIFATLVGVIIGSPLLNLGNSNPIGSLFGTLSNVPSTLNGAVAAATQIYNNLDTTARQNVNNVLAVLNSAAAGQISFDQIYAFVLTGIYIATSTNTNTTNSVGGLGLPTATLCQLGVQYQYTSCYICNQDCYVAHNLWGGDCGPSNITGSNTCLCAESAEEAATRNLEVDSSDACEAYNPAAGLESFLIAIAFRARYLAIQCLPKTDGTYDSTGCNVDCVQNHGFKSGHCQSQVPNVALPTGVYPSGNDKATTFCVCSHTLEPDTTYDAPTAGSTNLVGAITGYL